MKEGKKDKELVFFTPYDKQIEVLEALDDKAVDTVICVAGRQSGKTILAQNVGCKWCLENEGVTCMWVAPTDNQALKVYKEIIKIFPKESKVIKTKKGAKGDIEIIFTNGSQLLFRSAGSTDTLRGNSVHYLIVDEAAFVVEDTLTSIIIPTMNVKGRKKLLISTPKGKNYLYKWFNFGQSDEPKYKSWKSFKFTCYDSPYVQLSQIEFAQSTMTDVRFRQEYLVEFVDNASVFKNINDCLLLNQLDKPITGEKYYAGVDIGLGGDASVMCIIDTYGNLVRYFKWDYTAAQDVIDEILEKNRVWKFKKILFETNNNGLPMYQTLKKSLSNIEDFSTQTKSKGQIITRMIYLFDTCGIRCVDDAELRIELEAFNYKQNENGNVKYGAASGFHDDIIMAFCIARECYERSRYNGRYFGFF